MFKISTLWHPLKLLVAVAALFMFAFKIVGSKLSFLGPLALFIFSIGTLTVAPELPQQMTMSTLWRLIELSAYVGMFFGGYLLFKLLSETEEISYRRLTFGQMRM